MHRIAILLFALSLHTLHGANPALLEKTWTAKWIGVPDASPHDYGVYHFRRSFRLDSRPDRFYVHVTADNHYVLFVNGTRISEGPARGDLYHWRYETVDLSPHLKAGRNSIAAVVWNEGRFAAIAQISNETGFLLQGDTAAEATVNSGPDWRSIQDTAYTANPISVDQITGYNAIGPAERFDAARYPWGWEQPAFDDSRWRAPRILTAGEPRGAQDGKNAWMLVSSNIPQPERKPLPPPRVRRTDFQGNLGNIPENTKATFLLDQDKLTTGYPRIRFSGGRGARVGLRYAEGLWKGSKPFEKGDRNEIEGKRFLGYQDIYVSDGGEDRVYEPLFWRTWRYIEVTVETAADPLRIEEMNVVFSGYPFEQKARFASKPENLSDLLSVGWRTARLCAHDTYMDCPYYEQLQYAGDTRIQGLVSIYNSGDTRLLRNAIEQLDSSRTSDGLTFSRAPSRLPQYIPGFSLWWIGMVHDYWRYVDDPPFVKRMLPGVRAVLTWFQMQQKDDQTLGKLPWWNYLDWTPKWSSGVPPSTPGDSGAAFNMQLALGYRWAGEMEQALGNAAFAQQDRLAQGTLLQAIRRAYYDDARGLFADTPDHREFSLQTNALAVLSGTVTGDLAKSVLGAALAAKDLTPASTYFTAYVNGALKDAALGDLYLSQLGPWKTMLDRHLTTWAESLSFDRSDCHAWGSSPNFELYRTVLGIDSAAPGFKRVRVEPNLGTLTEASGTIPHPKGEISVKYQMLNGKLRVQVDLPPDTPGEFLWGGKRRGLKPGRSTFTASVQEESAR